MSRVPSSKRKPSEVEFIEKVLSHMTLAITNINRGGNLYLNRIMLAIQQLKHSMTSTKKFTERSLSYDTGRIN